jgi:CheY-like chemotaxis protein
MMIAGRRILIVDDDKIFRDIVHLMLEQFGYEVTIARDGAEAVKLCDSAQFDLVITDLIMPEKDGLETMAEVLRRSPGTKVIAMSGGGQLEAECYLEMATTMGASEILKKPFTPDQLQGAVEATLGRPQRPTHAR